MSWEPRYIDLGTLGSWCGSCPDVLPRLRKRSPRHRSRFTCTLLGWATSKGDAMGDTCHSRVVLVTRAKEFQGKNKTVKGKGSSPGQRQHGEQRSKPKSRSQKFPFSCRSKAFSAERASAHRDCLRSSHASHQPRKLRNSSSSPPSPAVLAVGVDDLTAGQEDISLTLRKAIRFVSLDLENIDRIASVILIIHSFEQIGNIAITNRFHRILLDFSHE